MKLAECKLGALVCVKPDKLTTDELRIGHIVGLTLYNKSDKFPIVVPLVKFAGNHEQTIIHYDDLDLFTAW